MLRRFFILVVATLLVACSSRPDADTIERKVRENLAGNGYGTVYEIINFHKTNGIPRDDNTYVADVAYDVKFKMGMTDAAKALQAGSGSIFTAGAAVAELATEYGPFKAGDSVHREQEVRFIRTEKGWLIDGPLKPVAAKNG